MTKERDDKQQARHHKEVTEKAAESLESADPSKAGETGVATEGEDEPREE
ncbi:hypothetical protein [Demequina globuliformis]|nr:hypothetical protein [Demequina globuliformis]